MKQTKICIMQVAVEKKKSIDLILVFGIFFL